MKFSELKVALGFTSDPSLASPQQNTSDIPHQAKPIRGWLAFFVGSQIIIGLRLFVYIARKNLGAWKFVDVLSHQSYWLLMFIRALGAVSAALSVYAGIALLGKWRDCVRLARLAMTMALVYVGMDFLARPVILLLSFRRPLNPAHSVLAPEHPSYVYEFGYSKFLPRHWKPYLWLVLEIVWCLTWLAYLRRSRRVHSTYRAAHNGEEQQIST